MHIDQLQFGWSKHFFNIKTKCMQHKGTNHPWVPIIFWTNNSLSFRTVPLFWREQILFDDALILSNE